MDLGPRTDHQGLGSCQGGCRLKLYQPGDIVEVDVNSGMSDVPRWVQAVVTGMTDSRYGWTPAVTTSAWHPRIERGPGWTQGEIREASK